jgi:hypothetical protein
VSDIPHDGGQRALEGRQKDAVKAWVPKVRRSLENEFTAQLKRLGLRRSGKHDDLTRMSLRGDDVDVRQRLEALLKRETMAEGSPERGFDTVVGELAYTLLNRLVGLKAMEARGLLYLPPPAHPESPPELTEVLTRGTDQAYSRFLRDLRAAGGTRYKYGDDGEEALLRDGLTLAFAHLTVEIGVLFDPSHEYACVWPTHATLSAVIAMINDGLEADVYRARDFLGWVYQFFNREEKERVRKATGGTPRTSHELAVINQFYTPSWVVKALVDNTLGRLWLQMHPDSALAPAWFASAQASTGESGICADYLVPRTGERIRYVRLTEAGEAQGFKMARDITLLDPACGTMHFGQYAMGIFRRMYLDEIEHAGQPGWPSEPSVKDPRDIPAAIVANNIFGVDIDPRAVQIASLSLMLTAKEMALELGYSPLDVRIRRANLAVANAVNLGEEQLRDLVDHVDGDVGSRDLREHLFTAIWDNLRDVGELGSLVQVRESVSRVLGEWVTERARAEGVTLLMPPRPAEQTAFGFVEEIDRETASQLELEHSLLEQQARQFERQLLGALEASASDEDDASARIFAEDTARGLKLLQLLSRSYDVVVMNPPYGSFVPTVKEFIREHYPLTANNIYAAFIDRGTQLVEPEGYVGALVSSSFVNLKTFEQLRTEILLKRNPLIVMLDLGVGILDDATVETAAMVLRGAAQ